MSLMPSLIKYFATVGGVLAVGLIGLNAVMQPGGPGPRIVTEAPKAFVAVKHDPAASLVERLRDDEAAKTVAKRETPAAAAQASAPAPQPVTAAVQLTPAVQPAPDVSAPVALASAPTQDEAAAATRIAQEKLAAEKARKQRLARAKAKAQAQQEAALSHMQDQTYYGYAPRPTYGPFGQGGGFGPRW